MLRKRSSARYEMDMTTGALLPKVLVFTVPLILTGILQLLYNAADVVVVGNFAGAAALAAVSSTGPLVRLLVNLFIGLSVGAGVLVARAFGAGERQRIEDGVHTAITVALGAGLLVGVFGYGFARQLLGMMGSPDDVIDLATKYLKIYFLGMPANMLYNFGAAILRAVGDTRRPLLYLTLSGLLNVALNLVLVIVFHMGVAGVAIATVASEVFSAALVLRCLTRASASIHLEIRRLRISWPALREIIRVGLPAGLQSCMFSIANVTVQSAVNSFGSLAMAGNGASSSLEGFVYTSMHAFHQANLTFASQNYGAGQYRRVRRVLYTCLAAVTATGLLVGGVILLLGPWLLGLYNSDPAVIRYGMVRLRIIVSTYFVGGIMEVLVGQLRGIGYSVMPMIVSLTGICLLRVALIMTIFQQPAYHTLEMLYLTYPLSWVVTALAHLACYLMVGRKKLDFPDRVRSPLS